MPQPMNLRPLHRWLLPCACTGLLLAADGPGPTTAPLPATGIGDAMPADDAGETPVFPAVEAPVGDQVVAEPATKAKTSDIVAAPMPFVNPTIGAGIGVVGMYLFPAGGPKAPPSKIALGAMASENHSWGVFGGGKLHLLDDRCRVGLVGGHLDLRYDYFGTGKEQNESGYQVALRQKMDIGMGELLWRIAPRLYLGPQFGLTRASVNIDQDLPPLPPGIQLPDEPTMTFGVVGLHLQYDSRNDTIYPTAGMLANIQANRNGSADGKDVGYGTAKGSVNTYHQIVERHVLAARAFASWAGEDAPFYALPCIGRGSDLRGYVDGRYRDHLLVAVQAEWRWLVTGRFGLVGFAGVAETAPRARDLEWDVDLFLPSIGAGARWRLSETFPMNLRFDVAWGKDEGMFYFSMGEAF